MKVKKIHCTNQQPLNLTKKRHDSKNEQLKSQIPESVFIRHQNNITMLFLQEQYSTPWIK